MNPVVRAVLLIIVPVLALSTAETEAPAPVEITIDQALAALRRNNPALQAALAGVDAARAQRDSASRPPNPTLTVGVDGVTARNPRIPNDNGPTFGIELEQALETSGKRRWRTDNAAALERAAQADAAEARRQQELSLQQSFWGALLAREQQRLADEDVASIDQSVALMREQVAAGAIAEGDLLRFQAAEAQFRQAQLTAAIAYEQAVRALAAAIGGPAGDGLPAIGVDTPLAPRGDLAAPLPELTREELRRRARERPDVLSATRQVEAAEAALRLADAQRTPNVVLGVGGSREGPDTTVGISASVELPVFNANRGPVVQAEALRRQAVALQRQALAAALTDAESAWLAYDGARRMLAIYDGGAIERARLALAATEAAYREGAIDLVAVLEARRTYGQTRAAYLQALYDARIGALSVQLLGSGGGGAHAAAAHAASSGGGGGDD